MAVDMNEKDRPAGKTGVELPATLYADRVEKYAPERIAEFLLNNAVSPEDYKTALEEIRRLGIDPATIAHQPPAGA
jgi:hypothetical protein